jgi:hypothetical protein
MTSDAKAPDLAEIVAQLRKILAWLDQNGHQAAAIEINSAIEKLAPSNLTVAEVVQND